MTQPELSAALSILGWSHAELARRLGYKSDKSVWNWRIVPPGIADWVLETARKVAECPPPETPGGRGGNGLSATDGPS